MASPADFCSSRLTFGLTIRLTEAWRSPLGGSNLWLSETQVPPAWKENAQAVELLRSAINQGTYFGIWLHRDPDFESLRDYPPFQELMRPKG